MGPSQARENLRVHGVNFAVAAGVFEDENALTVEDFDAEGEQRFRTLGMDGLGRLLVVVYTYRRRKNQIDICLESQQKTGKTICARNMISAKGNAARLLPPDPRKTRITIRLDTKILKWFWQRVDEAGGGNYQTMINEVLKRYIESEDAKTIRYPGGPHVELDDKYQRECEARRVGVRRPGLMISENRIPET